MERGGARSPQHERKPLHQLVDGDPPAAERRRHVVITTADDGEPGEDGGALGADAGQHLLPEVVEHEVGPGVGGELGQGRPPTGGRQELGCDPAGAGEGGQLLLVEHEVGLADADELPAGGQAPEWHRGRVA